MVGVDTVLGNRYRLGEKIATGGMGTVYGATDEKLGRAVAIKLLAANLADDAKFVERFRREARAAAGLRHPNIANVFDAGDEDDCHFIVMELAEGRDLARLLREEGPLSPERCVRIVGQICLALGHAHAAGIVHRDVKPANVIVDDDDVVKVTDFGIAHAADESKLTMTGSVLGTAHYISPEQASGKPLAPSSDIYSLGIVTFETLTGALPFTGESLMAVAMRHVSDEVPAPSTITPSVPAALDDVVRRATRKEPRDRFRDTQEMHDALTAALATGPATTAVLEAAPDPTQTATVWPIPGTRWDPVSLGRKVLVVFAVLGAIALALLVWRLASSEPLAKTRGDQGQAQPRDGAASPTGANLTVPSFVIGTDYRAVQAALEREGYTTEGQTLEGDALAEYLAVSGVSPDDAEAGEVVGSFPPAGGELAEGQAITLLVSAGFDKGDEHGQGKTKGHKGKDD